MNYDPFQPSFSTPDQLLMNPRVRFNPSKAYETILAATKADPDGWIQQDGREYTYGVLSGPLCGTYIMRPGKFIYTPRFDMGVPIVRKTYPLIARRDAAIQRKIAALVPVVSRALAEAGVPPDMGIEPWPGNGEVSRSALSGFAIAWDDYVESLERTASGDGYNDWWGEPDEDVYLRGQDAQANAAKELRSILKDENKAKDLYIRAEAIKWRHQRSKIQRVAVLLYIMSQASGVPEQKIISDLQQKPKRILSVVQLVNSVRAAPTRLRDRSRFSKELLETWSLQKAIKRILPNVEGDASRLVLEENIAPERVRAMFSGVPSWKQMAEREEAPGGSYPQGGFFYRGTSDLYRRAKEQGLRDGEFRNMLQHKGTNWIILLLDSIRATKQASAVLAESLAGRQLLAALERRDWDRVKHDHDLAVAAVAEMGNVTSEEAERRAEAFKSKATQFTFIPGVRPLITKDEYRAEGDALRHCVYSMAYYLQTNSWEFSFEASDGTRATLQLMKDGSVGQFFGPGDTIPSKATSAMLKEFLAVNKENINLMRKGQFPVMSRGDARPGPR